MDERKKDLVKNTAILMIGNFSSKILVFILVPLYTHYLLPSDYGRVDLYLTVLSMMYIVFSLQSIESAFRFVQDCKSKEEIESMISNAIATAFSGILIFSIIMIIYGWLTSFEYSYWAIAFVASSIYSNMFLHTIRGMNKTTSYVIVSVISTVISVGCNILFIVGIGLGALSLLITPIIVNVSIISMVFVFLGLNKYWKISALNFRVIRNQLKFSLPLIPNALCVWLLSSVGHFVLLFYYTTTEVGLLAFTLKFPLLLSTIGTIFLMAWQVSIVSSFNSKDKDNYASGVFNEFAFLFLSSMIIILPVIKIAIFALMGDLYIETWIYIPVFFTGVIVSIFAQVYNLGFYGAKKTNEVFIGSIIAASTYIILALILTKPLSILGVGIAYSISELVRWIYINKRVSKYLKIKIFWVMHCSVVSVIIIISIAYYVVPWKYQSIILLIGIILFLFLNQKLCQKVFEVVKIFIVNKKTK